MKHLLIILSVILLASCGKDDPEPEPKVSNVSVTVYKQNRLSTGEFTNYRINSIIHIWKGDNLTIKSSTDAVQGFAYDNTAQKSVSSTYSTTDSHFYIKDVPPGKYLIFVMDVATSGFGKLASSHTTFTVNKGEDVELNKIFSYNVSSAGSEEWNKNQ